MKYNKYCYIKNIYIINIMKILNEVGFMLGISEPWRYTTRQIKVAVVAMIVLIRYVKRWRVSTKFLVAPIQFKMLWTTSELIKENENQLKIFEC